MPKEICNLSLHNTFPTIYEPHEAEVSNAEGNLKIPKLNHITFPLPLPGTDVTVLNSADLSQNSPTSMEILPLTSVTSRSTPMADRYPSNLLHQGISCKHLQKIM